MLLDLATTPQPRLPPPTSRLTDYEGAEDYFTHKRSGAYDLHLEEGEYCGANCSLVPDRRGEYSVHMFTEEAVARIEASATGSTPFFIYLAYQSVHAPHQVPARYLELYPNLTENRILAAMLSALDEGVASMLSGANLTCLSLPPIAHGTRH